MLPRRHGRWIAGAGRPGLDHGGHVEPAGFAGRRRRGDRRRSSRCRSRRRRAPGDPAPPGPATGRSRSAWRRCAGRSSTARRSTWPEGLAVLTPHRLPVDRLVRAAAGVVLELAAADRPSPPRSSAASDRFGIVNVHLSPHDAGDRRRPRGAPRRRAGEPGRSACRSSPATSTTFPAGPATTCSAGAGWSDAWSLANAREAATARRTGRRAIARGRAPTQRLDFVFAPHRLDGRATPRCSPTPIGTTGSPTRSDHLPLLAALRLPDGSAADDRTVTDRTTRGARRPGPQAARQGRVDRQPNEAEAFSAKAAALIAAHRLDPDHVRDSLDRGAVGLRRIALGRGAYVRARLALLIGGRRRATTARSCSRPARRHGRGGRRVRHRPRRHRVAVRVAARPGGRRRWPPSELATPAATQRWRRSFLFGYARRIGELLADRAPRRRRRRRRPADTLRRLGPRCARRARPHGAGEGVRQGGVRSRAHGPRRPTGHRGGVERRPSGGRRGRHRTAAARRVAGARPRSDGDGIGRRPRAGRGRRGRGCRVRRHRRRRPGRPRRRCTLASPTVVDGPWWQACGPRSSVTTPRRSTRSSTARPDRGRLRPTVEIRLADGQLTMATVGHELGPRPRRCHRGPRRAVPRRPRRRRGAAVRRRGRRSPWTAYRAFGLTVGGRAWPAPWRADGDAFRIVVFDDMGTYRTESSGGPTARRRSRPVMTFPAPIRAVPARSLLRRCSRRRPPRGSCWTRREIVQDRPAVAVGQLGPGDQRAGHELMEQHGVQLGADQDDPRHQVEPAQQQAMTMANVPKVSLAPVM